MILKYVHIALRYFVRHKLFSLINVFCLGVGISFCILIGVYIINQWSVNTGLKDIGRQYVLKSNWKDVNTTPSLTTVGPLAKALKESYPNLIENYFRFVDHRVVLNVNHKLVQENITLADTSLVSMYGFHLVSGRPFEAFRDGRSAVISKSLALRLFGTSDVLDKTIEVQTNRHTKQVFLISAVLEDQPDNSILNHAAVKHDLFLPIDCDSLFSLSDAGKDWNNVFVSSFVKIRPGAGLDQVAIAMQQIIALQTSDFIKSNISVVPIPLSTYYLDKNNGAIRKMTIALSLIAAFILLMAIINYVNLNIGLSAYRLKEMGLRKLFGTRRMHLIFQHLTESVMFTLAAGLLSIVFYELIRPVFGMILDFSFPVPTEVDFAWAVVFFVSLFALGLISGFYPAFILSSTKLPSAIKGQVNEAGRNVNLRRLLLVVQFTVAIAVFAGSLIISKQITYSLEKDLGYDKEHVLVISSLPTEWDANGLLKMLNARDQFLQIPEVTAASLSTKIPDGKPEGSATLTPRLGGGNKLICPIIATDENFASVYGIQLKEGRFIEGELRGQSVINESALNALGWDKGAGEGFEQVAGVPLTVVGVVKDFHISSLHDKIQPLIIMNVRDLGEYEYLSIKLKTNNFQKSIGAIESKWKSLYPEIPFDYFFMNEKFQSLYKPDLQLEKASVTATVLNLVMVFLGLVGVVSLALVKRSKEIAMRKVLGADALRILLMFIKEYSIYILISNAIGGTLAYFAASKWLEMYAYRIEQSVLPFIVVAATMFIIIISIITIQCYRVAISNPVSRLRTE